MYVNGKMITAEIIPGTRGEKPYEHFNKYRKIFNKSLMKNLSKVRKLKIKINITIF
jgi:hypothetical protein